MGTKKRTPAMPTTKRSAPRKRAGKAPAAHTTASQKPPVKPAPAEEMQNRVLDSLLSLVKRIRKGINP